jgi:hypothetical protein
LNLSFVCFKKRGKKPYFPELLGCSGCPWSGKALQLFWESKACYTKYFHGRHCSGVRCPHLRANGQAKAETLGLCQQFHNALDVRVFTARLKLKYMKATLLETGEPGFQ